MLRDDRFRTFHGQTTPGNNIMSRPFTGPHITGFVKLFEETEFVYEY